MLGACTARKLDANDEGRHNFSGSTSERASGRKELKTPLLADAERGSGDMQKGKPKHAKAHPYAYDYDDDDDHDDDDDRGMVAAAVS